MIIDCTALRFYPTGKLWPKLRPIFQSDWCAELWKYKMYEYLWNREWPAEWSSETIGKHIDQSMSTAAVPAHLDSVDWRCDRIGRPPQWHDYVVHGACHWMAPVYCQVITELEPDEGWTLLTGTLHSTVWHRERGLIFDPQFEALGVGPRETFRLATTYEADAGAQQHGPKLVLSRV